MIPGVGDAGGRGGNAVPSLPSETWSAGSGPKASAPTGGAVPAGPPWTTHVTGSSPSLILAHRGSKPNGSGLPHGGAPSELP
eukprot:9396442-Alexandrium_andersonii.AAC.1